MIKLIGWDLGIATEILSQPPTVIRAAAASKELEKASNLTLLNPVLST